MRNRIVLADLTHTAQGISSLSFPLGAAFIASYAQKELGDDFKFDLFKFPENLARSIIKDPPLVLALSCYSWNLELAYKISVWAKQKIPDLVVIFGGPNFPVSRDEKKQFLENRPAIDFFISNEGEVGFVELLRRLHEFGFSAEKVKKSHENINNCNYLLDDQLVEGEVQRILDVNMIPSPYLNGMMDPFFELPLTPMLETTRGCPFSCTFCADGLPAKNRVVRFEHKRTRDELDYIKRRVKNIDEIIITDLNFGMYPQDLKTAEHIAKIQKEDNWPVLVKATAGKNKPERIIDVLTILKGSWVAGSSIQSSDSGVLKNVKRNNISLDGYSKFIDHINKQNKESESYTEIILGLPGDSKEKHFESLRQGMSNRISTCRMYQAMLLLGTEMASKECRKTFGLITKFRILPGCAGIYDFGGDSIPVVEIEEIIVGGKDMPIEDYVSCRVMNLLIESFFNDELFEEFFSILRAMKIPTFDLMEYLFENDHFHTPKTMEIIQSFMRATIDDLYDSHEETKVDGADTNTIKKLVSGEIGGNELLDHKGQLYLNFEDVTLVFFRAATGFLRERGLSNESFEKFLDQLRKYIFLKNDSIHEFSKEIEVEFNYDFKALEDKGFDFDPTEINGHKKNCRLKFFHTESQKKLIENAVSLYSTHPGKMGRMIQRSVLKKMYRHVNVV